MDSPQEPDLLTDRLDHLPERKRQELRYVLKSLFEGFAEAQRTRLSDRRRSGRILKVILFGSHARGGWVEDRGTGYFSDFDLLVVVNAEEFTDTSEYWFDTEAQLRQDYVITGRLKTPVGLIVHSLMDVNDQLARGRPFFADIARDGIVLYEAEGHPLAEAKPLTAQEIHTEALGHYEQWMDTATYNFTRALTSQKDKKLKHAAFDLHQTTEALYHCVLLTLKLYSPKLHNLYKLRDRAEPLDERLRGIWPRDSKLARQSFDKLQRAYVEARYSPKYTITDEQLDWLSERVDLLKATVETICREYLNLPVSTKQGGEEG